MIKDILIYLEQIVDQIGPLGIAIATFIESLIAPIPSEVVLVFAGTTIETWSIVLVYALSATIGSYLGTLPFYLIAYKSKKLLYRLVSRYGKLLFISIKDVELAEKQFTKKGKLIVFTGRLIPGVRSLISIPAGISKLNIVQYTIYTLSGSFCWNLLLISGGFLLRAKYNLFLNYLDTYEKASYLIIVTIVLIVYGLLYKRYRNTH